MSITAGAVGQLVAAIQAQMSARVPGADARGKPAQRTAPGRLPRPAQLQALIALRVKDISPDDPQRGRKALRVFLEAVLLSNFGDAVLNDPGFHLLVDDVLAALEADSGLEPVLRSAMAQLLQTPSDAR